MRRALIALLLALATPARAGDGSRSSVPADSTQNAPGYWRDSGAPCRPFSRWCDSMWSEEYGPGYEPRRSEEDR